MENELSFMDEVEPEQGDSIMFIYDMKDNSLTNMIHLKGGSLDDEVMDGWRDCSNKSNHYFVQLKVEQIFVPGVRH